VAHCGRDESHLFASKKAKRTAIPARFARYDAFATDPRKLWRQVDQVF